MIDLPSVTITTDGAARGNPGPGGWAALLQRDGKERLLSGEQPADTTNNAMELQAAIGALESLKRPCRVLLRADSTYVIEGLKRLLAGGAAPQKNRALWERLAAAARPHELTFEWVKGHAGDPRNERVDEAANAAAARAYAASESQRVGARPADEWVLALCSPAGRRPAQWALLSPLGRRGGTLAGAKGVTEPTLVYQALVQGLEAAERLAAGRKVALVVICNYELIVKQGRGEWKVKQPAQQPLAARVAELRGAIGEVRFDFATTADVLELIEAP
ncbi:MAG TPA: RNase H family protein [Roseiflexaceae bacterium]|nr:RNase H family protein [Roseiflexaceae bacterium]